MRLNLWLLAVCLLSLTRTTAGSILGAAVNIELLDQDRSQQVRFITTTISIFVSRFKASDSGLIYFLSLWFTMECDWRSICVVYDNIVFTIQLIVHLYDMQVDIIKCYPLYKKQ